MFNFFFVQNVCNKGGEISAIVQNLMDFQKTQTIYNNKCIYFKK